MNALAVSLAGVEALLLTCFLVVRLSTPGQQPWRLHEVLLGWQTLYWFGVCALLFGHPDYATIRFAVVALIAQVSTTCGALVAASRPVKAAVVAPELRPMERAAANAALLISALVCTVFVVLVVRNDELALMLAGVLTGDSTFLDYRMTMSRGKALYLAPGYIKQFRDILLPASLLTLLAFTAKPRWWLVVPLALIGSVAAVLSGERSVIMIYVFVLGAGAIMRPGRGAKARRFIVSLVTAAVFATFIGATVLLGRASANATPAGLIVESAGGLFDRAVLTVPRENSLGFSVWGALAPTWGRSWASALSGILPGSQRGLDSELHFLLGGGEDGNAPLGLPADTFLAFGVLGVAFIPFAYVLLLARADRALLESSFALPRALRIILVPISFGWYSPFLFVLNGGLILVFAAVAATALSPRLERRHG